MINYLGSLNTCSVLLLVTVLTSFDINEIIACNGPKEGSKINSELIAQVLCIGVDNWVDMPVFVIRGRQCCPANVSLVVVWEDGRIVWEDKQKNLYCKARVSPHHVSELLKKLLESHSTKSPFPKFAVDSHSIAAFYTDEVSVEIYSDKLFKIDEWSSMLYGRYMNARSLFIQHENTCLVQAMSSIQNEFYGSIKNPVLNIYRDKYNNRKLAYHEDFTDKETVDYSLQFISEAEFFVLATQSIGELISKGTGEIVCEANPNIIVSTFDVYKSNSTVDEKYFYLKRPSEINSAECKMCFGDRNRFDQPILRQPQSRLENKGAQQPRQEISTPPFNVAIFLVGPSASNRRPPRPIGCRDVPRPSTTPSGKRFKRKSTPKISCFPSRKTSTTPPETSRDAPSPR